MTSKDKPRTVFIPNNYKAGISIFGFKINLRYAIEGGVLACIPLIIGIVIVPKTLGLSFSEILPTTFFFVLLFGALGIYGIDNSPVSVFITDFINAKKNKRETYYNPRVKNEVMSIFSNVRPKDEQMLPREKILEIINKYQKQMDNANQKELESESIYNKKEKIYFEDDIGIVNKPYEYMSEKEIKMLKKQEEKIRKENERNEKKKRRKKGGKAK